MKEPAATHHGVRLDFLAVPFWAGSGTPGCGRGAAFEARLSLRAATRREAANAKSLHSRFTHPQQR